MKVSDIQIKRIWKINNLPFNKSVKIIIYFIRINYQLPKIIVSFNKLKTKICFNKRMYQISKIALQYKNQIMNTMRK